MRITLALAVICAAVTACGGSSAAPDITGESYDGLVTLRDAGAGEQRTLRYDLAEGDRGRAVMTFAMTMDQQIDGMAMGTQTVEYSVVMEYQIAAASADGDYRVSARYIELDADPIFRAALEPILDMEIEQTISSRGEIRDATFRVPPGVDPVLSSTLDQMSEQMGDLAAPLPLSPVGVGATWSHSATTDIGGLESTMVTTYEVTGFEGDRVLLGISSEVTDFGDELTAPGMPPGTKMSITDFESTTKGTNQLDLARPFASPSSVTSNTFMKIHIDADGLAGDMEQTMTMEMTVAAR
jgi:hypothetical protein